MTIPSPTENMTCGQPDTHSEQLRVHFVNIGLLATALKTDTPSRAESATSTTIGIIE